MKRRSRGAGEVAELHCLLETENGQIIVNQSLKKNPVTYLSLSGPGKRHIWTRHELR